MTAVILTMLLLLDPMNSAANWTGGPVENDVSHFRVDENPGQLTFALKEGEFAEFVFSTPIDLTSARLPTGGQDISLIVCESHSETSEEPPITITLSSGAESVEYVEELPRRFGAVCVHCPYDTLQSFRVTARRDVSFTATRLVAFRDDFPLDITSALVRALERIPYRKRSCGTVTASVGTKQLTVTHPNFIQDATAIEFNGERHRLAGRPGDWKIDDGPIQEVPEADFSIQQEAVDEPAFLVAPILDFSRDRPITMPAVALGPDIAAGKLPALESHIGGRYSVRADGSGFMEYGPGRTREWTVPARALFRSLEEMAVCREILDEADRLPIWVNDRRYVARRDEIRVEARGDESSVECNFTITITETSRWRKEIQIMPTPSTTTTAL